MRAFLRAFFLLLLLLLSPVSSNAFHLGNELIHSLNDSPGEIVDSLAPDTQDTEEEGGLLQLDAKTPYQLLAQIRSLHHSFAQQPSYHGDPNYDIIRPLYAPKRIVNEAYRLWSGRPGAQPCKDSMSEAIFAYPVKCMHKLDPHNLPKLVNVDRRDCLYTTVRCVDEHVLDKSVDDVLQQVKECWKLKSAFWIQPKLYGAKATVEEAWKRWREEVGGREDGPICAREPAGGLDSKDGTIVAVFPENSQCADDPSHYGCRNVAVDCI